MATFDNSYRKCYNKRSDNNKKAISHQSPKFALYGVFAFMGINSRRAAKNAVQRNFPSSGNTKSLKLYAVQGQRETVYLYIQKRHFVKSLSCGYKIVIIFPLLSHHGGVTIMMMKGAESHFRKGGRLSEAGSPYLDN